MRAKEVFLLGVIVCWTAVCNGEYGSEEDYSTRDKLSKLLTTDEVWLAGEKNLGDSCTEDAECGERHKCRGETDAKVCECADGLGGAKCETDEWCEKGKKFENCAATGGTCKYETETRSVECTCGPDKKLHPTENKCRDTCTESTECLERQKCKGTADAMFCECADGLSGDDCQTKKWCEKGGKFENCEATGGTCEYKTETRSVECTCGTGKKLHPTENKCRDTCNEKKDCGNGVECTEGFCVCTDGLVGDKCDTIFDCSDEGKYRGCKDNGATCTYEKNKAVCTCPPNLRYDETKHICTPISCVDDSVCGERRKCAGADGAKTCECADGLSGPTCEALDWCLPKGKFENCKGLNGSCQYNDKDKAVVCICGLGKQFRPTEKRCRGTCVTSEDCENKGECLEGFCDCKVGLTGDKCETIFDCSPQGKYRGCKVNGATCTFDGTEAVCKCPPNQKYDSTEHKCKAIPCEDNSGCGKKQKCAEGSKTCVCADGLSGDNCEKNDWCEGNGKFINCKGSNGTCEYVEDKRSVDCTCKDGKKLHPTQNRCVETCETKENCGNNVDCIDNFCVCKPGLIGDRCETIADCTQGGKFRGCDGNGATCTFDGTNAVCNCPANQQYHAKEHVCKDSCVTDASCNANQTCTEENGWKSCVCAAGLSGKFCEKKEWCEDNGKFKNCKDTNGTCEYNSTSRSVECTCTPGKVLHPTENRCRDTCTTNSDCLNEGTCNSKFCTCKKGLLGDKCEKFFECTEKGKFKGCEETNGACMLEGANVICKCPVNQQYDGKNHVCKECNCGPNGRCRFENGEKKCDCDRGFNVKEEICTATCENNNSCKDEEKCEKVNDWNTCVCADGLSGVNCVKKDWCEDNGKFGNCKGVNGTCGYVKAKRSVDCTCDSGKTLDPNENRCRGTCANNDDCKNGGTCNGNYCSCNEGFFGDKCETIFDCSPHGKYKACKSSGGICSLNGNDAVCTCPQNKKLHETENICKAPCTKNEDCKNEGTCENGICNCPFGLTGDICNTIIDCEANGRFQNCRGSGGTCNFEGGEAVCKCPDNKKYHETEHICKATCNEDSECTDRQKCSDQDGWKSCVCADGLSGTNCEKDAWCEGNGIFKNCKGVNGSCGYVKDKRAVECTCAAGKSLNPNENRCRATCSNDDCQNGGTCENTFCSCKLGIIGDKCETVFDCSPQGKYKGCVSSGGTCSHDGTNAVCTCPEKKELNDKKNICEACDCGDKGKCRFENGAKKCDCDQGFAVKNGICTATCVNNEDCKENQACKPIGGWKSCVCGEGLSGTNCENKIWCEGNGKFKNCKDTNGTCEYNTTSRSVECTCTPGKLLHPTENRCREICATNDDCHNKGTCNGKFCSCKAGLFGDKCETVFDCTPKGKFKGCESSSGTCSYDDSKSVCNCPGNKRLHPTEYICKEFCNSKEDCHGGQCVGEAGKQICNCPRGLKGDRCEIFVDCVEGGKYEKCATTGGVCSFENNVAKCTCGGSKALDTTLNICREKCDNNCENEGTCNTQTHLCKCKPGTTGDKCETITACGTLKCEDKGAKCIFKNGQPTCECNDKSYYYINNKCEPKWCIDGCNNGISDCEYSNGVGVCKCKTEGTYYNYETRTCQNIDKCVLLKCGDGKVCKNGACVCDDNHDKKEDKCEPKNFCEKNNNYKCFNGAKCEASSPVGYVICSCEGPNFYNPKKKYCEAGTCFLPDHKKDCKNSCPKDMVRTNGICTHKTDSTKCEKDCGTLGWCYKVSDKEVCVCEPGVTDIDSKTGKCVLKASTICPTSERDGEDKCKCIDQFKPAKDGVTCELKSCSDQDVKDRCKARRAVKCVDNWKTTGYKCVCPEGYIDDPEKGCIDPCTLDSMKGDCRKQGKKCYIGGTSKVGDCKCLPTFTENPTTGVCEPNGKNTVMIQGLPVLSKNYEDAEKNIDKVSLHKDVSNSMKMTFKNLDFVYVFSLKAEGEILFCDVWLQFKAAGLPQNFNVSLEAQRWKSIAVDIENRKLLPPALFLNSSVDSATEEELTLCSASVQQSVCGKGSKCEDNKCTCQDNYREIESTIQMYGETKRIVRCEAIDICKEGTHSCPKNSKCVNLQGDYFCKCDTGYRKKDGAANEIDKKECVGLCEVNPCEKGECKIVKDHFVDCTCQAGYSGSFCDRKDERLAKASQSTKVVGAVLGTMLAVVIILIIVYIVRKRKNAYSEDFTPPPRNDNAEMSERRPMRGVTNRAYQ